MSAFAQEFTFESKVIAVKGLDGGLHAVSECDYRAMSAVESMEESDTIARKFGLSEMPYNWIAYFCLYRRQADGQWVVVLSMGEFNENHQVLVVPSEYMFATLVGEPDAIDQLKIWRKPVPAQPSVAIDPDEELQGQPDGDDLAEYRVGGQASGDLLTVELINGVTGWHGSTLGRNLVGTKPPKCRARVYKWKALCDYGKSRGVDVELLDWQSS